MFCRHHIALVLLAWVLAGCKQDPPRPTVSLVEAARTNNLDQMESHFHWGCDVNAKDESGRTPLHWATMKEHRKAIELLIEKFANVNLKDYEGWTPLDLALRKNNAELASLLKMHGAKKGEEVGDEYDTVEIEEDGRYEYEEFEPDEREDEQGDQAEAPQEDESDEEGEEEETEEDEQDDEVERP